MYLGCACRDSTRLSCRSSFIGSDLCFDRSFRKQKGRQSHVPCSCSSEYQHRSYPRFIRILDFLRQDWENPSTYGHTGAVWPAGGGCHALFLFLVLRPCGWLCARSVCMFPEFCAYTRRWLSPAHRIPSTPTGYWLLTHMATFIFGSSASASHPIQVPLDKRNSCKFFRITAMKF